jgi:hypothetical protein
MRFCPRCAASVAADALEWFGRVTLYTMALLALIGPHL